MSAENEFFFSKLYTSHFLSTWNARTFEFATILFTTSAYPGTLLPVSVLQITSLISVVLLSVPLGIYLDRHPRLPNLRHSIVIQRVTVIVACAGYFVISTDGELFSLPSWAKTIIFATIILLKSSEQLANKANAITMERDWVPTLFGTDAQASAGMGVGLTTVNAGMRRIDLSCKLFAPLFISFVTFGASSILSPDSPEGLVSDMNRRGIQFGIFIVAGSAFLSSFVEWRCARLVYEQSSRLQAPKLPSPQTSSTNWSASWRAWLNSPVCLPTVSLALLYTSTLAFSSSLITYLLNTSFSLTSITVARSASSVIELFSTLLMPAGVIWITEAARRKHSYQRLPQEDSEERSPSPTEIDAGSVERIGLWGIWWELLNLIAATLLLFVQAGVLNTGVIRLPPLISQIAFFAFIALSRLGLWTFDLSVSQLTQTLVSDSTRGQVSGIEVALRSLGELSQYVGTAIWHSAPLFRWITVATTSAVELSVLIFTIWIRQRRGHLMHWEKLRCGALEK